jgi:hypothetical protein
MILRTGPDPELNATVGQSPFGFTSKLIIFNGRESVTNGIDRSTDHEIVTTLVSRISALPETTCEALLKLILAS